MAYGFEIRPEGLYYAPGDFFIDPVRPVHRAVVTHGHADHARRGHLAVIATPQTLGIMENRYGDQAGEVHHPLPYHQRLDFGSPGDHGTLWFAPAGHVLGSAQAVMEFQGHRTVITGDFKRQPDRTCPPFEVVPCDVFITEATFALPVFTHPPVEQEIKKIFDWMALFPERAMLIGCYGLGKCQRLIAELRAHGHDRPIYLHGALMKLTDYYQSQGVEMGDYRPATAASKDEMRGQIVLCPPSATRELWSRRVPDPIRTMASGWNRVRFRAAQRGVDFPLIISDHSDWTDLCQTIEDVNPKEVWVTHGREEALMYHIEQTGRKAQALRLIGYEEEEGEAA